MDNFLHFWRKDAINKLIVLVVIVIVFAVGFLIFSLATLPGGETFLASFIPTPTLSTGEIFKRGEQTATAQAVLTRAAVIPTITTMPFTPQVTLRKPSPTATSSVILPTATVAPTEPNPETSPSTSTPTPTRRPSVAGVACFPQKNEQVGKVLEVIDGFTVRVLIGDLVYVVRYTGLVLPEDTNDAEISRVTNAQLVYAKEIKLYADTPDKDESSRLLRYVVVGDGILVNQELISQGLAAAENSPNACSEDFQAAEQDAKSGLKGMWKAARP